MVGVEAPFAFIEFFRGEELQGVPGHVVENVEKSLITELGEVSGFKEEVGADVFYVLLLSEVGVKEGDAFLHITKVKSKVYPWNSV